VGTGSAYKDGAQCCRTQIPGDTPAPSAQTEFLVALFLNEIFFVLRFEFKNIVL
jgi:hypothetical protein